LLDEFDAAIADGKYEICNKLDGDFHFAIAAITENNKLIEIFSDLSGFLSLARFMEKKSHPLEKNRRTLEEHRRILEAIRSKNVKLAEAAMVNNIETMLSNLDTSSL
jgi:DNA-binding GntR family transcriptional regulator